MIPALIDLYESQAPAMNRWIAGLSREDLISHPVPGTWSIQQLVIHMLDSDLIATHRLRRILAEDNPLLIAYDETLLASKLPTDQTDIHLAAQIFELNRRFTAGFLRHVPARDFARTGIHNQRGKITATDLVTIYTHHVEHHEPFLVAKRQALGKPMGG